MSNMPIQVTIYTNLAKARAAHAFVVEQFAAHAGHPDENLFYGLRDLRWMLELDVIPQLEKLEAVNA